MQYVRLLELEALMLKEYGSMKLETFHFLMELQISLLKLFIYFHIQTTTTWCVRCIELRKQLTPSKSVTGPISYCLGRIIHCECIRFVLKLCNQFVICRSYSSRQLYRAAILQIKSAMNIGEKLQNNLHCTCIWDKIDKEVYFNVQHVAS